VTNAVHEALKAAKALGEPDWSQPGSVAYWRGLTGGLALARKQGSRGE
jgi:hypothetical protein